MSRTLHRVDVAFTTHDEQHWRPEHRAGAEAMGDWDDYAFKLMYDAVHRTMRKVIAANPDMFVDCC